MKINLKFGLFTIALLIFAACTDKEKKVPQKDTTKEASITKEVTLDLYVMSQCPYGVKALDAIIPAVEKVGKGVRLKIDYIGKIGQGGQLDSMHGQTEVDGNMLQMCAEKLGTDLHYQYISCLNRDWRSLPNNWESCANEVGIDPNLIASCKNGPEGRQLLSQSFVRAQKAGATGSPTIILNGSRYQGGRTTDDFFRAICTSFSEKEAPKACQKLRNPEKVNAIIITDKRCKSCQIDPIIANLTSSLPGLAPTILDWSDTKAQEIVKEAGIKVLPAVLFDESLEKDEAGAERMARWLQPAGKYKMLKIPADFDPTAEICDNKKDDSGNGKVDCEDEACALSMACREENPGQLDLFVMSECPYGVMAFNTMKEIIPAFGNEIQFNIHYIAEESSDGFNALHGQSEVDENIRQLCAIKHYPERYKYMDYIWCRSSDLKNPEWEACTGSNGIATKVIDKCFTGPEGKKLLSDDIKITKALKISASPTWLANNTNKFSGVGAQDIQKNFCEYNPNLSGCKKEIKATNAQAPKGSCGP